MIVRPPRSVRMRLALWYAAALGVALVGYAAFVYLLLWGVISSELDHALARDVEDTLRMLEDHNGQLTWDEDEAAELGGPPPVEVYSPGGDLLFRSPAFPTSHGEGYRTLERLGKVEGRLPVRIRAARSTAPMRHELNFVLLVLAVGIPLAVALSGTGGYLLARRALRPLDRMAREAEQITAERLSDRLVVDNPHDELGRLGRAFNQTFARLERSFEQLRRFTADASHEMRTPLTSLRSIGEVGLSTHRGDAEYREIIGSMLEEVDRLARLVESLLVLSRADGGQIRVGSRSTELGQLAREVVLELGVLAEEKSQEIELVAAEVPFVGDPLVLRRALVNLLDNAVKYSPEGSTIRMRVARAPGAARIEVQDEGPGIAAEHRERIFDRFYRIDKARAREFGGVGLGLSIARWAVEAHGGTLELAGECEHGSVFRISLPDETARREGGTPHKPNPRGPETHEDKTRRS